MGTQVCYDDNVKTEKKGYLLTPSAAKSRSS